MLKLGFLPNHVRDSKSGYFLLRCGCCRDLGVFRGKNASGHAVLHYKVCSIQTTMDTKGSGASEMSVSFPDSPVRIPGKEWKGISAPELAIASWF